MARLKLFTATKCPKCPEAKRVVEEVAKDLNLEYEIVNIDEGDNLINALQYQIASTPSIVIDEQAEFIGVVPTKEELIKKLNK